MISTELARKFIERVTKYTDYNVNIMDDTGTIIASRDPERLGQFHAIAYRIITGSEDMVEVTEEQTGNVRAGVNMVIEADGQREGVVGVTGDPEEIRAAAMMTKMAIETMLRYERQQEERRRRENRKEQFVYLLTQVADAGHEELLSLAADLGLPEERIRIPILVRTDAGDAGELLLRFRAGSLHSHMDFSIAPDPRHVLIFKTVPDDNRVTFASYQDYLLDYLKDARKYMKAQGRPAAFYIGSFQENYKQYYHSYRHCKWLESNVRTEEGVVFFYDHVNEYLQSIAPMRELDSLFHIYAERVPEKTRSMLIETILTLQRHNFHFAPAAEELYIHKNTLVYRYNQIRDMIGLDPVNSAKDRALIVSFCVYLDRINKIKR